MFMDTFIFFFWKCCLNFTATFAVKFKLIFPPTTTPNDMKPNADIRSYIHLLIHAYFSRNIVENVFREGHMSKRTLKRTSGRNGLQLQTKIF